MKRAIKYTSILLSSIVLLVFGYYIGMMQTYNVNTYSQLSIYLSTLNDIEKNNIEEVKKSLNHLMDINIITMEETSKSWFTFLGEDETSGSYARILRYRKYSGYKYIPEPPDLKKHKRADDILNAR